MLGDNSNPIDGHQKKLRWPSMGLNGVSVWGVLDNLEMVVEVASHKGVMGIGPNIAK